MDAEKMRAWLHELRHGGHPQTAFVLADETGYCCLGLAVEKVFGCAFSPERGCRALLTDDQGYGGQKLPRPDHQRALGLDTETTLEEREKVAQITDKHPDAAGSTRAHALSTLNDEEFSFARIADFIEEAGWHTQP